MSVAFSVMHTTSAKQLLNRQFDIAENGPQKAGSYSLACMHWHGRYSPVRMPQKDVAASGSYHLKPGFFKQTHQFLSLQPGKAAHTEICWIPTSSSGGLG